MAALVGALLPFGGHRGGNVALLVELLATLSGASFSLDAAPFDRGDESPRVGLFVLAVNPGLFPGAVDRFVAHLETLSRTHGVRLPAVERTGPLDVIDLDDALEQRLRREATSF